MKLVGLFRGILLLCLIGGVQADTSFSGLIGQKAGSLVIEVNQAPISLIEHLHLLEDPGAEMSFSRFLSPEVQARMQLWNSPSANFGFTRSAYWVAFTLRNPSDRPLPLLIRQDYPLIDHVDFWAPDGEGNWRRRSTGDRLPFASRPLALRDFVFPETLPANTERTYYMRYASQGSLNISLSVSGGNAFLERLNTEQLLLGIYYGGFLVLLLYNLFLFMAVRDRAYFYYICYAISFGLFFGVHNGLSYQFIWPGNPWLANQSLLVLIGLSLIFGIQFVRDICSGRKLAPGADRFSRWLLYLIVPLTLMVPFVSYRLMIPVFSMLSLIASVQLLLLGVVSVLRGSIPARYFMAGWIAVSISVIAYMLKTFGWLPHNGFTQNAFQVGALLEMVLLSLALGARITEIEKRGYIDELSGLYNRRHFDEQLTREFHLASRSGTPLALLVIDLDHFKAINDRYGHHEGDRVIRAVGELIQRQIRKPAVACRYGGEEFVILLPRVNLEQAGALAQRLVREVVELEPNGTLLTTSIGVAAYEKNNYSEESGLFEASDAALYRAKREGRNRVVMDLPVAGGDMNPGFG